MVSKVMVVEDDPVLNKLLVQQISDDGYSVVGVSDSFEMRKFLSKNDPDIIILDDHLPGARGIELLPELSDSYPVIMLTAYASVRDAVQVVRNGASDYLSKPIDAAELLMVIKRVLTNVALKANLDFYRKQSLNSRKKLLIGESQGLQEVQNMINMVAPNSITVLINGESGVGKELVAQELHHRSDRHDQNFIAIDCCTIQESLFESELFGHEKGSFSGAVRSKKGLIETAEKGTLFMDEIGEISPAIQAKLLRVIETGTFRRIGSVTDRDADVRIVAATNRNLVEMAEQGTFRSDLLYRLNAFTIMIPPLRQRPEDISALVDHFIQNHDFSRKIAKGVSPAAMQELLSYPWPGNVRELKNVIERAIILSQELVEITPEHLAFSSTAKSLIKSANQSEFSSEPNMEELQKQYLSYLLQKYKGHRGRIAMIMGISERNLYRFLQKHKLSGK